MRNFLFISGLLAALVFQSCSSSKPAIYNEPVIGQTEFDYWIHSPLHPDSRQAVTFKTSLKDTVGISKIELYIYEYELYTSAEDHPSKRRKIDNQWGLVHVWEYSNPIHETEVAYKYEAGFHDFSNVEYHFKVYDKNGELSERMAQFDAGKSPWADEKILLYSTSRKPLKETINLCFLPDTDYNENWDEFLNEVESLIYDGYHSNNKVQEDKDLWQFYYTKHEMDGRAIAEDYHNKNLYPDFLKNALIQGVDAFGLLHKTPYGDGAYLKRNLRFLSYNLFTSEAFNHGTAIHETAHAVFNLSDEYDQCVCFENPSGANVFSSLKACRTFNKDNGFPIEDCTPIQHLNGKDWYMSEKDVYFQTREACEEFSEKYGYDKESCERFIDWEDKDWFRSLDGLCIMQDDGDSEVRDFERTCSNIIDKYYFKIRQRTSPQMASQDEIQENIFGYEPVIIMELQTVNQDISFDAKQIRQGVPHKNFIDRDELQVDFYNEDGEKQHSIPLANPGELMIHGESGEQLVKFPNTSYRFAVPYEHGMETIQYKYKKQTSQPIRIK